MTKKKPTVAKTTGTKRSSVHKSSHAEARARERTLQERMLEAERAAGFTPSTTVPVSEGKQGPKVSKRKEMRPIDQHRTEAARPLQPWSLTREDGVCVLVQNGQTVGTWRDYDMPWLWDFLFDMLPHLHGTWHVARTELVINKARDTGRAKSAEARDPMAKHPGLARAIRACLDSGKGTTDHIQDWMAEHDIRRSTLYDLITRIKAAREKK
ncbi:MAG: hypothetical protein U1F54_23035 [Burkholderiales bacterium]